MPSVTTPPARSAGAPRATTSPACTCTERTMPGGRRGHLHLDLHRLQLCHHLSGDDLVADRHVDAQHRRRHRRDERAVDRRRARSRRARRLRASRPSRGTGRRSPATARPRAEPVRLRPNAATDPPGSVVTSHAVGQRRHVRRPRRLDPIRVGRALGHLGPVEHVEQEPEVRRHAEHDDLGERAAQARDRVRAVLVPRDRPSRAADRSPCPRCRPRAARCRCARPASAAARDDRPCRPWARSPRPGPRRRRGPRSRGRAARSVPGRARSGGRRRSTSWARTRSTPVTASVTGCSTCSRVFISRNHHDPSSSSRNSAVPAPR